MPLNLQRLPHEPADLFTQPFARFLRIEAASGTVLLLCVAVALGLTNSPWSAAYLAFWETPVGIRWGNVDLSHTIKHWLNDGAMTLFFFVVALELKRETVLGELRDPRTTAFAMAAALGGMLVPALLFVVLDGSATPRGWGIAMATDTAFVIGCLALLGSRIPRSLRLFLLSLAIFDDIGAILVIAIGYGSALHWNALGCAALGLVVVAALGWMGVRAVAVYIAIGVFIWLALSESGIHPTLTGVLLGFMTPTRSWVSDNRLHAILGKVMAYPAGTHWSGDTQDRRDLHRAGIAAREAISPLERIELFLHPWVAFVVLPLFALANAGFPLSLGTIDWRLTAAIVVGLSVGKPLGIVLFSLLATRLKLGVRPEGLSWPLIAGGAALAGIGFTMAILIAELALSPDRLGSAKLGILSASLLSAASGVSLLLWLTSAKRSSDAA
jgi:NhaA family Na+:H+ antiporter